MRQNNWKLKTTFSFTTLYYQLTKKALHINTKLTLALLVTLLGFASSCKNDDDSNLGLGVQPPSDNIPTIVSDSFTVLMTTVDEDSLRSDFLTNNPIGVYNDPVFGEVTAALYTDLRLPDVDVDFTGVTAFDKVVLTMRYSTSSLPYGDTSSEQTFKVYQLTEQLNKEQYFTNTPVAYNSAVELGSVTTKLNFKDSVTVKRVGGNVTWAPHLTIEITDNNFKELLRTADPSVYANQDNFRNLINGLAIVPTGKSGIGVITPFDMQSSISNLTVYFNDTSVVDFNINEDAKRVSNFTFTNRPANITMQFNEKNKDHDTTYIQSMGSVKTLVTFPYLFDLVKDGSVAIKGAEIEFFVDPDFVTDNFYAPARMLIAQPGDNGLNAGINPIDLGRLTGSYNPATGSYKFSITSHLQEILLSWLNNKVNNNRGLYVIIPIENPNTPSRVVLDASKTKLKLFYNKVQ